MPLNNKNKNFTPLIFILSLEKTVAASAHNGANTLQVINSYGFGFASTINISWVA